MVSLCFLTMVTAVFPRSLFQMKKSPQREIRVGQSRPSRGQFGAPHFPEGTRKGIWNA
jgi:hypothetical protein